MNYFEKDLKYERVIKNKNENIEKNIPNHEDYMYDVYSNNIYTI